MSSSKTAADSDWQLRVERQIAAVRRIADPGRRERALAAARPNLDRETVQRLYDDLALEVSSDPQRAAELATAAADLAELLDDDFSRALAVKAAGFLLYLNSEYEEALDRFEGAADLFRAVGADLDYAATRSTALHTLSYLGRYDDAYAAAAEARKIFEAEGEELRLARLDTNEGNLLFRQERLGEAEERFRSALAGLRRLGGAPQDVATALHNLITCGIALHDFDGAMASYDELMVHCEEHGLKAIAAQAEYNIAYLYFLRGQYDQALELYREARALSRRVGDRYHEALCDLDQSEIWLELNLHREGARLAAAALTAFEELGLGYEKAKALTFLAIAGSQDGRAVEALQLFRRAQDLFREEGNDAWVAILDLYQAVIYHDEARLFEARKLALSALRFFEPSRLTAKAVICNLLLARIELHANDLPQAAERVAAALASVSDADTPALAFRARLVAGQVAEAVGDRETAVAELESSADLLENLRSHLRAEELKLSFLRDKQEVYETLVWLLMLEEPTEAEKRSAFLQMERAKSRILADLVSFKAAALPATAPGHSRLVEQMRRLRNELNWYYRQIDLEEIRRASNEVEADSALPQARLSRLQRETRRHEDELIATLGELRHLDLEFGSLQTAAVMDLEAIRETLPAGTMLLEYFEARETVYCCCLGRDTLEILPLTTVTLVRELQERLAFQLGKFRLGTEYVDRFEAALLASTEAHLRDLYVELVAPLGPYLEAEHLVVVPHGGMHYLPFHALLGDDGHLLDAYSVSYAPSAHVYALCTSRGASGAQGSLVMGVPGPDAPAIRREVEAVARVAPQAQLFIGEQATRQRLVEEGAGARLIHLATHGFFREDNPMFSAIQLGDCRLTLFDLYSLRLDADLVVLSGCGTGLSVVAGGDELIGLGRGLLYAGARSVVASLWEVHDESAVDFMSCFYELLAEAASPATALQQTMLRLRKRYPHPYYWAPFVLTGRFAAPVGA